LFCKHWLNSNRYNNLYLVIFGPARLFGGRYPAGRAIATRFFLLRKASKKAQTYRSIPNANRIKNENEYRKMICALCVFSLRFLRLNINFN